MSNPTYRGSAAPGSDQPAAPDESFDPYRFGAPEHPVPPEYAPPGYVPPAATGPAANGHGPNGHTDYYAAPPFHQYPQPKQGNGKAIASLVLGILAILCCAFSFLDLVLIIPAMIFGSLAYAEANRKGGAGRGIASAGFICAMVAALLAMLVTIWLYPKVARCANDYSQGSEQYNSCIRDIVK